MTHETVHGDKDSKPLAPGKQTRLSKDLYRFFLDDDLLEGEGDDIDRNGTIPRRRSILLTPEIVDEVFSRQGEVTEEAVVAYLDPFVDEDGTYHKPTIILSISGHDGIDGAEYIKVHELPTEQDGKVINGKVIEGRMLPIDRSNSTRAQIERLFLEDDYKKIRALLNRLSLE